MTIECVKCGEINPDEARLCIRCTWPFSSEAWRRTGRKLFKVTIDTSCINAKGKNASLNRLQGWADGGRLVIQRADVMLDEILGNDRVAKAHDTQPHPEPWLIGIPGQSEIGVTTFLGGPDLHDPIRDILFPTTRDLSPNQERDIEHLRSHVSAGGDAFLTLNTKDFIQQGKEAALSRLGIWVFTPDSLVSLLTDLYGWEGADA
jgi:hypothetical protein